jgi:transcriptional regulator with XRE-family HTH domain
MASSDIPIGERVRFYRTAKKKKQVVVAGLAGITVEYLSQIERGLKTPGYNPKLWIEFGERSVAYPPVC